VETVTSFDEFLALEPEWDLLVDQAGIMHPFLTHEWIRTWWEAFGSGARLHILVARSGSRIVAIAPFMFVLRRRYGLRTRCLELMVNPHTPRSGLIVSSSSPEAGAAIWRNIFERDHEWDVLNLSQIPQEPAMIDEIGRLCGERKHLCGIWPSSNSPYVATNGDWDRYRDGLSRKHRSNLRNRLSRLEGLGAVELEIVSGEAEAVAALEEGLVIEAAAWKGAARSAILSNPRSALFYRTLASRAARRSCLSLQFLNLGGRRIAFHYSLVHRSRTFLLKPGYDPNYRAFSPGTILCYLALREAFSRRDAEFDFGGESDEYKMQWTDRTRPHCWFFVFPPRLRSRLMHFAKFRVSPWLRRTDLAGAARHRVVTGRPVAES